MENLFVTKELLKQHKACQAGLEWFEKEFPEGAELCEETIAKIKDAPAEFVWWFYDNVQQDKRLYPICGVNRSDGGNRSGGADNRRGHRCIFRGDGRDLSLHHRRERPAVQQHRQDRLCFGCDRGGNGCQMLCGQGGGLPLSSVRAGAGFFVIRPNREAGNRLPFFG